MKRTPGVFRALDEARFGAARTLNLRDALPTAAEAARRTELWLREKQMQHAGNEVLIITGRGNQSVGQIPVVREEVRRVLALMRRRGVVAATREHTPGSYVVRLASLRTLLESPHRSRRAEPSPPAPSPASLAGLSPDTQQQLRALAVSALEALGVRNAGDALIAQGMARQFEALASALPAAGARERLLRDAIDRALTEFGDADR